MLAVAASNGQDIVAPFNVVITGGSKGVTPVYRGTFVHSLLNGVQLLLLLCRSWQGSGH